MSANGKRCGKLFLAGHKNRAVKESKNGEHSVRNRSRLAVSALELSAAANDHPNESGDQRADHHQHKQHTSRKSGAYAIDSAAPIHARWFLATFAGESRGHRREKQTKQREQSASHETHLPLLGGATQERSDIFQYPLHRLR